MTAGMRVGAPMESQQPGYCPVCGPAELGHNKACPYGRHEAAQRAAGVPEVDGGQQ
jgi:hypothetical protein